MIFVRINNIWYDVIFRPAWSGSGWQAFQPVRKIRLEQSPVAETADYIIPVRILDDARRTKGNIKIAWDNGCFISPISDDDAARYLVIPDDVPAVAG